MKAKMKCSSCGAEMDNLNMSWGKKQWLYIVPIIPIMLLGFYPLFKMTVFKGDPSKEMSISEIRKQTDGKTIEIMGLITNTGRHEWTSVTVEVEFFGSDGKFLDEKSEYIRSDIKPGDKEHFKISIRDADQQLSAESIDMKLKIAGGRTSPF